MTGESTSEFKGENSAELAKTALKSYIDDSSLQIVKVEITTSISDTKIHSPTPRIESSDSFADGTSSDTEIPAASEDNEQETPSEEREAKKISPNTSHHRVLYTLDKLDDSGAVPSREVKKHVTGVNETSIYPAITQLWERKLADRERVEDVDHPYYEYTVSDYGQAVLEEIGEPSQEAD